MPVLTVCKCTMIFISTSTLRFIFELPWRLSYLHLHPKWIGFSQPQAARAVRYEHDLWLNMFACSSLQYPWFCVIGTLKRNSHWHHGNSWYSTIYKVLNIYIYIPWTGDDPLLIKRSQFGMCQNTNVQNKDLWSKHSLLLFWWFPYISHFKIKHIKSHHFPLETKLSHLFLYIPYTWSVRADQLNLIFQPISFLKCFPL